MWLHWHVPTCSLLDEYPWTISQVSVMYKTSKIYMCVSLWTLSWASTVHTLLESSLLQKKLTICHLNNSFCVTRGVKTLQLNQWKINFSQPIKIWIICTTTPDSLQGYHINNFKGTYRDFNLHNQLHIHKICSSDINKSPCFGTSQVPLSDPSQHPQNGPLQGRWAKTQPNTFTHTMCVHVCVQVFHWGYYEGYWEDSLMMATVMWWTMLEICYRLMNICCECKVCYINYIS